MSAGLLLIDGYNLMHAAGLAQSDYRPGELLRCRTKLLKFLLSKLSAAEIKGTTIIFDARDPPPDRPAQVVVSGLTVLFANPGGDADVVIQEWLSRHSSPRRVTLVSSDRLLQRASRSYGAKFVGSEDFVHDLERRRGRRPTRGGPSTSLSDDEKPAGTESASQSAHWLKVFGDVSIVEAEIEINRDVQSSAAKSAPAMPASRPHRQSQKPRSGNESKPIGELEPDEKAYWLKIFGDQPQAGTAAASPGELRLADLEQWLKEFEATENNVADKGE
jgi:predicted RNA-binding protein with PIN domain